MGSPRAGDPAFAAYVRETPRLRVFNVKNLPDLIPEQVLPVVPDFGAADARKMLYYETAGELVPLVRAAPR